MRKLILRITLPLLLLAFFVPAYAQDVERPEFKMSCREVLKLGLEKFTQVYGEKMQDYSNAGQKAAFEYYVKCKRPANDEFASKSLSAIYRIGVYEAKRLQIDDTREELNKFGAALWTLRYAEEGGGTMWGVIAANAYADREDFMETFIKTLAASERHLPRSRRLVNASLARIQRWLSSPKRKPYAENSDPNDVVESKKLYLETMKEAQDALAQLRTMLHDLPDVAAERLAARMASETKNALADSP
ncbi:MAG: hypothetical protein QOJ02_2478 [Acidobacteriota bacterium]|jgi:hypothetical protein|nr:hypothetical protein [Acidobacteriota bacterium]